MCGSVTVSPLSNASEQQLEQIIQDAERVLNTQLTVGLAADQRALVFSGFLAAASVALAGGCAATLMGVEHHFIGYLAAASAVGLLVCMALSVYSARPVAFEWAGNEPLNWYADVAAGKALTDSMREQAVHYQGMIETNRATLAFNSLWVRRAQLGALIALILTAMVGVAYFTVLASSGCASVGKLTFVASSS